MNEKNAKSIRNSVGTVGSKIYNGNVEHRLKSMKAFAKTNRVEHRIEHGQTDQLIQRNLPFLQ